IDERTFRLRALLRCANSGHHLGREVGDVALAPKSVGIILRKEHTFLLADDHSIDKEFCSELQEPRIVSSENESMLGHVCSLTFWGSQRCVGIRRCFGQMPSLCFGSSSPRLWL